MKNNLYLAAALILLVPLLLTACTSDTSSGAEAASPETAAGLTDPAVSQPVEPETVGSTPEQDPAEEVSRPEGWDQTTHGKKADPNYEVVFSQDQVKRIDITISPENWQAMQEDMTALYGNFGTGSRGGAPGADRPERGGQNPLQPGEQPQPAQPDGQSPQDRGQAPGNRPQGGGGMMEDDDSNPIWVPVTIEFEGDTWTQVGMRFKGNSSLSSSWRSGSLKLPFKLDFDEFADEFPEIDDQRFYGFKQLSFASNFKDDSFLREKVAADIFREAGVPAAHTAFYQVYVDCGEGSMYLGLYTMVEVVDDTVIEEQFADDGGNLYKPSGQGATFAAGTFTESSFDKETNQDEADYSDIQTLFAALHDDLRTTDPAQWRAGLESVLDVEGFLNWLAVNTVIQNWDTYGGMSHNYYLYNNPETGLLTWIPWDNNEALRGGNMRGSLSLGLEEVTENWPLIRYLMDDPVYQAKYVDDVAAVIEGAFDPETISARYQELGELIRPYVVGSESGEEALDSAISELIQHAESRYQAARAFLDGSS